LTVKKQFRAAPCRAPRGLHRSGRSDTQDPMDYPYFMQLALKEAETAFAAGEFPVGCILVCKGRVMVTGRRTGTVGVRSNEVDHAEMIALRRLAEIDPPPEGGRMTLFTTLEPCLMCMGAILLSGIGEIVYAYEDVMGGATGCERHRLNPLYREARIVVVPHVLRERSLALFKRYFSRPEVHYWADSLLARHTLKQ
jgi:tRNA(adenine34) deaminase